jgi:hypothetical protein
MEPGRSGGNRERRSYGRRLRHGDDRLVENPWGGTGRPAGSVEYTITGNKMTAINRIFNNMGTSFFQRMRGLIIRHVLKYIFHFL